MRQQVQLEYRCSAHETPQPGCVQCDWLRVAEVELHRLQDLRGELVKKIYQKLGRKEIMVCGMR
jgi:hypothetical protein